MLSNKLIIWGILSLFIATYPCVADDYRDTAKPIATLKFDISGSSAWYPYFIPDAEHPGIVAELVSAVLARANILGVPTELPPKRTLMALEKGELDFDVTSPSWFAGHKIPEGFVISEGLIEIREYLVTLPENQHLFSTLDQMHHQQIGTVRGYLYNNDAMFERVDFNSEYQLIKALQIGRIQAVIMGDLPASYWAEQIGINIAYGAQHSEGDLHFRLREEHAHLLAPINKAIDNLKNEGKVEQITSHYIKHTEQNSSSKLVNPSLLAN
ncbi:transporter substrate-binding domain-containing protein [Planctobacterium marinum]